MPRRQNAWALWQAAILGVMAAVLWWLARNTQANLDQRGLGLGFDFLRQPANFEIGDTSGIPFGPENSFGRAIFVGLINTARVAVVGCVLSITLGFVLGISRLSSSPALRGIVRAGVELMRNTPLLLLLLFLAATLHSMPSPRNAFQPLPGVFISNRGLVLPLFGEPLPGPRSVIEVAVTRVADSCGYSVPLMSYEGDRDLLPRFWERKSPQDVLDYRATKNATSIDGLPAVPTG